MKNYKYTITTTIAMVLSFIFFGCNSGFKTSAQQQDSTLTCHTGSQQLMGREFLDDKFLKVIDSIGVNTEIAKATKQMVLIKGGTFEMGGDHPDGFDGMPATALAQADELPKHTVAVGDFWMDEHEVTVGEYLEFVKATGYKTVAEYDIDWEELKKQVPMGTPKPDDSMLKAGAMVFSYASKGADKDNMANWWTFTPGVSWRNPDGKNKNLEEILNLPVTQVSWYDAMAYAKWVGKRLPTEAEFEYALRSGKQNNMYPWGNEKLNNSELRGNFLQGEFPYINTAADGFVDVAPIKSFAPNDFGLYDLSGNVWEWTSDWYSAVYYEELKNRGGVAVNPMGPQRSYEVYDTHAMNKVVRGGSFLCHDNWCSGYRNSRRMRLTPDSGMQHLGFRLVRSVS